MRSLSMGGERRTLRAARDFQRDERQALLRIAVFIDRRPGVCGIDAASEPCHRESAMTDPSTRTQGDAMNGPSPLVNYVAQFALGVIVLFSIASYLTDTEGSTAHHTRRTVVSPAIPSNREVLF